VASQEGLSSLELVSYCELTVAIFNRTEDFTQLLLIEYFTFYFIMYSLYRKSFQIQVADYNEVYILCHFLTFRTMSRPEGNRLNSVSNSRKAEIILDRYKTKLNSPNNLQYQI
jgi:hypothetical protein